jgi:hypothetical protein
MARRRPPALVLIGLGCSAFAALYLLWILLASWPHLHQLLTVFFGNPEPLPALARDNLASTGTVRVTMILGAMRCMLVLVLLAAGAGLVLHLPWARWTALFGGALVIALGLFSTILRLSFLTAPGSAVRVTPLLMDAAGNLFAIVVCGTMFLPDVTAAYAGLLEDSTDTGLAPRG